jgi:hypothetical protein
VAVLDLSAPPDDIKPHVLFCKTNVTNFEDVSAAFKQTKEKWGRVE